MEACIEGFLCFIKKSLPRARKGYDLSKQSSYLPDTGKWAVELDEEGQKVKVHYGEKAMLGMPVLSEPFKDSMGYMISYDAKVATLHDMVFKATEFDDRPAIGRCVQAHTFKDATLPDGKPNPKPMVVDKPGRWEFLSFAEMKQQARAFGTCLRKQYGIMPKEKISIWSSNCVEWMLTDLACSAYNWTSVSVYDTLGANACSYILADSGAKVLVCEDKTFKQVVAALKDEIYTTNRGSNVQVVFFFGKGDAKAQAEIESMGIKVVAFDAAVKAHISALEPDTPPGKDDMYTLMYTSGTTGMPKGVMITHLNIVSVVGYVRVTPALSLTVDDVHLSYLPLAHIFERMTCLALLQAGAHIYFASNGTKYLLPDLSVVRPTIFAGVPKVYENVRDAVARKMTGIKGKLLAAALKYKTRDIETGCGYSPLWDILIFSKTKKALGGRARIMLTGGAPISKATLQWVNCALGPVVNGYGATETSAACCIAMPWDLQLGHVGAPMGQAAIRLVDVPDMNYFCAPADQYAEGKARKAFQEGTAKNGGEVWVGGPGVSSGYYDPCANSLQKGLPSNGMLKKTREDFFVEDGWSWFKTGDIGCWTESGSLKIVDRRKNIFKTTLGEYVPVEEVEKYYMDGCCVADFVFLPKETKVSYIGLCVIVSESIGAVMKWAKENGVRGDEAGVVGSPQFKKYLFDDFQRIAKSVKLQRFMWAQKPENLYVEYQPLGYQERWVTGVQVASGTTEQLLTATFKSRRTQLDQYFAPAFPKMYPDRPADHVLP